MMTHIRNHSKIILFTLLLAFAFGCKSSKKMEAAKEKARMEQEQEAKLRKQQEEEAKRKEAEERARREAEAKMKEKQAVEIAPKARLNEYFQAIAGSNSIASANNSINEALTLFASPETPVLIVISESGGQKDYDRPTTIKDYLNYLKDQKKNINSISSVQLDSSGKITEVELKKSL